MTMDTLAMSFAKNKNSKIIDFLKIFLKKQTQN